MHITARRTACYVGLALTVSCALTLPAAAKDGWPARRIGSPATVGAERRGASAAATFRVACPCPDGPTRVAVARRVPTPSGRAFAWAGAGIGAGVTGMLALSVALVLGRRRQTHAHLTS